MDFLLKKGNNSKSKKKNSLKGKVHPKIQKILDQHELLEAFNQNDFRDIEIYDEEPELDIDEEISIHEKVRIFFITFFQIIELLADKIIYEKENRLQTEIQMNKIRNQNQKQIEALETMLKGFNKG